MKLAMKPDCVSDWGTAMERLAGAGDPALRFPNTLSIDTNSSRTLAARKNGFTRLSAG
jgi:hypothetical protein